MGSLSFDVVKQCGKFELRMYEDCERERYAQGKGEEGNASIYFLPLFAAGAALLVDAAPRFVPPVAAFVVFAPPAAPVAAACFGGARTALFLKPQSLHSLTKRA